MPRPYSLQITPDTPDADGLADNNDSSGSSLTLDGALTSGGIYTAVDGMGHQISITDTATVDQSGATFTVTGTNVEGEAITEDITGPTSGATVESTKYFKTITAIDIASGAGSGTVDVGTVDEIATPVVIINHRGGIEIGLGVVVTGTINYTVQHTLDDVRGDVAIDDAHFFNHSALAAQTSSEDGNYDSGLIATRLVVNSFTGGATIRFLVVHGD